MRLAEIVTTCTHNNVAEAAVASIGDRFFNDINRLAARREMSVGAYVASLVLRFAWRAGDRERALLAQAMRGAQTPMLAGLRHILDIMIAEDSSARADMAAAAFRGGGRSRAAA